MMNWVITSSVLILIIILLRTCLKGKISLRLQYALWLFVAVRLLFPFSIGETVISIGNWMESLGETKEVQQVVDFTKTPLWSDPYEDTFDSVVPDDWEDRNESNQLVPEDGLEGTIEYEVQETIFDKYTPAKIASAIWIVGMVLLGTAFFISNVLFARKLRKHRIALGNVNELCSMGGNPVHTLKVYQTNVVDTPCLYGLFSPSIYVTEDVMEKKVCLKHVLEHEMTHYRHCDYIWSLIRVLCLVLHWYNPLVWWAAMLSRNDAELACDEATIKRLGEEERASYGRTLIDLTCEKRSAVLITATTMTGSKKSIKERIFLIAKNPQMRMSVLAGVILLVVLALLVTFTGAQSQEETPAEQDSSENSVVDTETGNNTENQDNGDNTQAQKEEVVLYSTTADLNYDGIEERIDVVSKTFPGKNNLEQNAAIDGVYVKVYLGDTQGVYAKEPVYISAMVTDSHASNGTYALTEVAGKEYFIYSCMYEHQGSATYEYAVMHIEEEKMVVMKSDRVAFYTDPFSSNYWKGPRRDDVVPKFKEGFEPWIENATILVSYDTQTPSFVSTESNVISANVYYDLVWARNEKEDEALYIESVFQENIAFLFKA